MNSFAGSVTSPGYTNALQNTASNNVTDAISNVQNWANVGTGNVWNAYNAFNTEYNNPYASSALTGAQNASNLGTTAATNIYDIGSILAGSTLSGTLPYASQIAQTAFDPQSALYNRTLQQTQDQTRASEAARGISTSPYGAGLENDQLRNFNIDWQNTQLSRQAQGASALSSLYGTAATGAKTGASLMSEAPSLYYTSSQYPYQTQQTIGENEFNALKNLLSYASSGQNLAQTGVTDWINALNAGTSEQSTANQVYGNELKSNQQTWNQASQVGNALGNIFSLFT